LLLTTGQPRRQGRFAAGQPHPGEQFFGAADLVVGGAVGQDGGEDVVERGEGGQQVVALEDETGAAAVVSQLARGEVVEGLAVDFDQSVVGAFDGADEVQQGGFAGAGWPGDGQNDAWFDRQADPVDGGEPLAPRRAGRPWSRR